MDYKEFFGPNPVVVELQAEDRWQAIDELLDQLVIRMKINADDRTTIAEAVKKREKSMSTGIGYGIGIPHASTDLVSEIVGIVGVSRIGVNFESLDAKPVKVVVLFLAPHGQVQAHLSKLASIAKLLHRDFGPKDGAK